tara:strand:+ start:831 stop:1751 length:921 start_codon:yes stop_codon:yes gene_type:complete
MKKALIIGTGSISQKHLSILSLLNYEIYVYSKNNNKSSTKNSNIKKLSSLNNLKIFEFAIIANKTSEHLSVLKKLVSQKIHLYCEKPIFHKKFDFKSLRNKIKKSKIVFHNGYQLQNDDKIRYIKKKLKNINARSFQIAVGHDFTKWRKQGVSKNSYFSDYKKGGGVIFELVHEINLISLLFGKIKKINTFKLKSKKYKCEDIATSIITTKKNIIGTLYQDMYSNVFFREFRIVTNKGYFLIDLVKNRVIENEKIKQFKNHNKQLDLIKRNIMLFLKRIQIKDYSLKHYDELVFDLNICLKMHDKQ